MWVRDTDAVWRRGICLRSSCSDSVRECVGKAVAIVSEVILSEVIID